MAIVDCAERNAAVVVDRDAVERARLTGAEAAECRTAEARDPRPLRISNESFDNEPVWLAA
jgi:hypothetical protein